MKTHPLNLMIVVALLCLALPACSTPSVATPAVTTPEPTLPEPTITPTPEATVAGPIITPTPEPTITPTPEPTVIQHVTQPENPVYFDLQLINDCTMNKAYVPGQTMSLNKACDNRKAGFIERPVTADLNTYLPYLDIQKAQFGSKNGWIYARIQPYDIVPQEGDGDLYYALELDLNFDGLSDMLISVQNLSLSSVVWTVTGVRAWQFVNGNVTQVFDQGVGVDPDMIWVRRVPQSKNIEFAFKIALLDKDISFGWWAWAYQGKLDPTELIPLDTFADRYQIDNTCALGYNGDAQVLPNVCQ